MTYKEHIYSVLIVSASDKLNNSLVPLLSKNQYEPVHIAKSISLAKRHIAERSYDLVIINAPLPDDFGMRFAIDLCNEQETVPMLLVSSDIYNDTYLKVMNNGVFVLKKPTSVPIMIQSLDWMKTVRERFRKVQVKVVKLEDKMSEIRIVNRAKWALIENCQMSEDYAHKYIEKQAMDRCVTKREIAENILQTYK